MAAKNVKPNLNEPKKLPANQSKPEEKSVSQILHSR